MAIRFNIITNTNEFIIIIFCYLMVPVITMCNLLIKRLIRATFLSTPAMFMNDENKHHGQAIKIARETTNNQ